MVIGSVAFSIPNTQVKYVRIIYPSIDGPFQGIPVNMLLKNVY